MMMLLSFHLSLHVLLFLFSLYTHIFVFLFYTKMPWWVCVKIRFYCTQQVIMSLVIYDFFHTLFVCCGFVMDCQKGRLLGYIWNLLEHMLL